MRLSWLLIIFYLFFNTSLFSQPFTKKYLMALHTCGGGCSDPRNHTIRLAESDDGINWNLVPNFQPYSGSVPDAIIRGSKLYLFDAGSITIYDKSTNTWSPRTNVQVTDLSNNPVRSTDPSLYIDDQGRIVLFFLNSTGLIGDPAGCNSYPCTKYFDSAVEEPGSDGKSYKLQTGHRALIVLNAGFASDPDIFFDGTNYYMFVSHGQSTAVYKSASLHGSFSQVPTLPNGILTDAGGIACCHYDSISNKFWSFVQKNQTIGGAVINRAVHKDFNLQLTESDFSTVISGASLGLDPWVRAESPGFFVNDLLKIPDKVQLNFPINNQTNVPITITFVWNEIANATKYHLQISTNQLFTQIIIDDSTIAGINKTVTSLLNNQQYYWRVKAINSFGYGEWSTTFAFTTIVTLPSAPTLLFPSNGSTNQPTTLTLAWNTVSEAASYHLQLSTDSLFTSTTISDTNIITTSKQITLLENNRKLFWRVRAKNVIGWGVYSSIWNFTTIVSVPAVPTLISPANGSVGTSMNPTLNWNASTGATSYRLQVATDSLFNSLVLDDSTITNTAKQVGPLLNNTKYYWRLNAKNIAGTSAWSMTWNFATLTTNIEKEDDTIPTEYKLTQNYPNPFNPTTTIQFDIPQSGFVTLKIYNTLGKEIANLLSTELLSGRYEVKWIANKAPSGIYFVRLQTNNFDQIRKIILMK